MNVCLFQRKYLCRQVNAGVHRTYSMCTSVNRPDKKVEVENILFIYGKGEGKGGCLEGGRKGISIYDCIDFVSISFSS